MRLQDYFHRIGCRGRVLKDIGPRGIETRLIDGGDELIDTLPRLFGLDVPEPGEHWPPIVARNEKSLREQAEVSSSEASQHQAAGAAYPSAPISRCTFLGNLPKTSA